MKEVHYVNARPGLKLKTWPRFHPVSLILSYHFTLEEVTENDIHSSLLRYGINYGCKKFNSIGTEPFLKRKGQYG